MLWIGVFLLLLVIILLVLITKNKSSDEEPLVSLPYRLGPGLLTNAERSFYEVLLRVAPTDVVIFVKVRVADVITPLGGMSRSDWQIAFNKVKAKHFDFLVCDKSTLEVRFVLELDDASHQRKSRVNRDIFLDGACSAAGLEIKRVKVQRGYQLEEVRAQLFGTAAEIEPPTLSEELDQPIEVDSFRNYDLHMSKEGFDKLEVELQRAEKREPQVYVHVGVEGPLANQVIRIGRAKNGTYNRWFTSGNGHKNTFLWAIGNSDRYGSDNAKNYSNYLLFFAGLHGVKTKLYLLSLESPLAMNEKEKELIDEFSSIWEYYRDEIKYSKDYPRLTGKDRNQAIVDSVSKLGMARKLLDAQRKNAGAGRKGLPDVLAMGLKPKKIWM